MQEVWKKAKILDEYFQESVKDLQYTEANVQEFILSIGPKLSKWARYLYEENVILEQCEQLYKSIFKKYFHQYMYEPKDDIANIKLDKKYVERYVENEKDVKEARLLVVSQQEKCKFIQSMIDTLKNQSFLLNAYIKHLLWQAGNDQ